MTNMTDVTNTTTYSDILAAFEANAADKKLVQANGETLSDTLLAMAKGFLESRDDKHGAHFAVDFYVQTGTAFSKIVDPDNSATFYQQTTKDGYRKIESTSLRQYLSTLANCTRDAIMNANSISDLRTKNADDPRVKALRKYAADLVKAGQTGKLDELIARLGLEVSA